MPFLPINQMHKGDNYVPSFKNETLLDFRFAPDMFLIDQSPDIFSSRNISNLQGRTKSWRGRGRCSMEVVKMVPQIKELPKSDKKLCMVSTI